MVSLLIKERSRFYVTALTLNNLLRGKIDTECHLSKQNTNILFLICYITTKFIQIIDANKKKTNICVDMVIAQK
jgi:hypothetical protein